MRRPAIRAVVAMLAAAAIVFGLVWLGQFARERLEKQRIFTIAFADLRCETPPGQTRAAFLKEVQYLGGLPDRLNTFDPQSIARLVAAFQLHPWVETVESVSLRNPPGPTVRLKFRTPTLNVAGRVVDGHGVVLRAEAPADGLPVLRGPVPPHGPEGAAWGDAAVEGAARTAAFLQPLPLKELSTTPDGIVLVMPNGRVTWGRAVGDDRGSEPSPEAKRDRLKQWTGGPLDLRKN